jgi:hypothetical protein
MDWLNKDEDVCWLKVTFSNPDRNPVSWLKVPEFSWSLRGTTAV